MSHLRSFLGWVGSIPAAVPSLSPQLIVWGSTPDLDPAPDPFLCCTSWPEFRGEGRGSTPGPSPVPSLSHLSWFWGVVYSRKIWSQLHFFCLQKSFSCTWLDRLIAFKWPMNQKPKIESTWDVIYDLKLVLYYIMLCVTMWNGKKCRTCWWIFNGILFIVLNLLKLPEYTAQTEEKYSPNLNPFHMKQLQMQNKYILYTHTHTHKHTHIIKGPG